MDRRGLNREDFNRPNLIDPVYFNGEVDLWAGNSQPNSQQAWNARVALGRDVSVKRLPTIEEEAQAFEDSILDEERVHVSKLVYLYGVFLNFFML